MKKSSRPSSCHAWSVWDDDFTEQNKLWSTDGEAEVEEKWSAGPEVSQDSQTNKCPGAIQHSENQMSKNSIQALIWPLPKFNG